MRTMSKGKVELGTVDIKGLAAECVSAESWCHSGPVMVSLEGVDLAYLLEQLPAEDLPAWFARVLKEAGLRL